MTLAPGCPRCPSPVSGEGPWHCSDHGVTTPLWRPVSPGYDDFADCLGRSRPLPSLAPWPLPPGWAISDFGAVTGESGNARACFVTCAGPTDLDGVVEVSVVSEEPGVGLGARCAGVTRTDPGADLGDGPPATRVRVEGHQIPLWPVSTSATDSTFDRSVFAGEAHGRWMWVVLRPASAALMLVEDWPLTDLGTLGPELVALTFVGAPPAW